jgi:hypothetical protein
VLTVTIVLIPLKSYDFQKAYLTLYYDDRGGIAAFLIVQTAMLWLTEVKLPLDRIEPQRKVAMLPFLKSCKLSQVAKLNIQMVYFGIYFNLNYIFKF